MSADHFEFAFEHSHHFQPFRIYTIELKNGMRLEIDHVGALEVKGGMAVFVSPGGIRIVFDHESVSHFYMSSKQNLDPS